MIISFASLTASVGVIAWRIGFQQSLFYHGISVLHEAAHYITAKYYKWQCYVPKFWPNPWLVLASTKIGIPDDATKKQRYVVALSGPIVGLFASFSLALSMFIIYRVVCRWVVLAIFAELTSAYGDLQTARHKDRY